MAGFALSDLPYKKYFVGELAPKKSIHACPVLSDETKCDVRVDGLY